MESGSGNVTVSVRYRPGNLQSRPPVKVVVDGGYSFSLSNEGVRRLSLEPGTHDFMMRCRFRSRRLSVDVESPTRITIRYNDVLTAKAVPVDSDDELDYERAGY